MGMEDGIDVKKFTDTEKEIILKVVARDEELRIQEKNRLQWVENTYALF